MIKGNRHFKKVKDNNILVLLHMAGPPATPNTPFPVFVLFHNPWVL